MSTNRTGAPPEEQGERFERNRLLRIIDGLERDEVVTPLRAERWRKLVRAGRSVSRFRHDGPKAKEWARKRRESQLVLVRASLVNPNIRLTTALERRLQRAMLRGDEPFSRLAPAPSHDRGESGPRDRAARGRRVAASGSRHSAGSADDSDSDPPLRRCAAPDCDVLFAPKRCDQIYHDKRCGGRVRQRRHKASDDGLGLRTVRCEECGERLRHRTPDGLCGPCRPRRPRPADTEPQAEVDVERRRRTIEKASLDRQALWEAMPSANGELPQLAAAVARLTRELEHEWAELRRAEHARVSA